MRGFKILLAVLALLTFAASAKAGGGMMGTGTGFHHNGFNNRFFGYGYGGFAGYSPYNFGIYSPYAAGYSPLAFGSYGGGYGGGFGAAYGGCNAGFANGYGGSYGSGYGAGYGYSPQILVTAPAFPAYYNTGAYGAFPGYNSFFFSRFIRGRNQVFRH